MWKARYQNRTVAAKQLTGMSDLVGMDEALLDLINEVCVWCVSKERVCVSESLSESLSE